MTHLYLGLAQQELLREVSAERGWCAGGLLSHHRSCLGHLLQPQKVLHLLCATCCENKYRVSAALRKCQRPTDVSVSWARAF